MLSETNSLHKQSSAPIKDIFTESFCLDLLNDSLQTYMLNENFIFYATMYFFSTNTQ